MDFSGDMLVPRGGSFLPLVKNVKATAGPTCPPFAKRRLRRKTKDPSWLPKDEASNFRLKKIVTFSVYSVFS